MRRSFSRSHSGAPAAHSSNNDRDLDLRRGSEHEVDLIDDEASGPEFVRCLFGLDHSNGPSKAWSVAPPIAFRRMMKRYQSCLWLGLTFALGCRESAEDKLCSEVGQCADLSSPGVVTQGAVEDCSAELDMNLDEAETESLEDVVDSCSDQEECFFVVCVCEALASDEAVFCRNAAANLEAR
ncbi:MAG: hypothetical protein AAGA56_11295 [Myxococcota bacterium]